MHQFCLLLNFVDNAVDSNDSQNFDITNILQQILYFGFFNSESKSSRFLLTGGTEVDIIYKDREFAAANCEK